MAIQRRTKIVCTIGPACNSREMLKRLVDEGMNIARLNFSHGNYPDFTRVIQDIRSVEAEVGRPVGIMGDIQGPKIRVGTLEGGQITLTVGQDVYLTAENMLGGVRDGKTVIPVDYRDFIKDVGPGYTVLMDDGLMSMRVIERLPNALRCQVLDGGLLKDHKGINVPEASFSTRSITEKDYGDILFCLDAGVDFIALSFVRTSQEVRHLKSFIESRNKNVQVISKIEKPDA
jgi:pyruvate kinase